jgi:RNA polymerase sigma-70 factor (ECF subfamily)
MQQNQLQNLESMLLQISSGNQIAFGELFKFYDAPLTTYIMGFTRSQFLTEEIVQDVFLKIWLNRTTLTEIECFKSYLFVTARNHTLDCLKQINRKKKREKEWIDTIINQASV